MDPEERAAREAGWAALKEPLPSSLLTPEEQEARLAAWITFSPKDYLPFVKGIMEGRRPAEVWHELNPNASPSSCAEAASRALKHPRIRELLSAAQIARIEAIGRDTVDLVVEFWDEYRTCKKIGDHKNALRALENLKFHYGGFEKGSEGGGGKQAIQINIVYENPPPKTIAAPTIKVLDAHSNGS